ncbi:MAG TPA: PP2C family protein-serine/threonine phosphatase [Ignavibacteriaceae bacterium]|nr:PP2C family protein-serine/threonine phosphatase [Ignavibacteriaceae bacterium]
MDQKKLHKTVETIASKKFLNEDEMLIEVLKQLVEQRDINVIGGRIWKLEVESKAYRLFYQTGKLQKIRPDFQLKLTEYPIFDLIAKERTILGNETNSILRKKGIFKYSASGVGDKIKINEKIYYEYILALNSNHIDEELRLTLNIIATALTSQIKQRRYSKRAKILKADIDKARELQKSILPEHHFTFYNYELFGVTDPAEIVGGDFFDYLQVGDDLDRLGIALGDAASKGLAAAAEAMYISGALRMASNFQIKIAPLMKRMNELVNKIFADDKFTSLFYGELSTDRSGLFLYANAGHNPPLFVRKNSDEIILLQPTGPVLGPTPMARFTVENINFEKDDVLLIYSDGITDSANAQFENYGDERLIKILKANKHLSAKEICYTVLNDVLKFSANGKYSDDKTIVVIKRVV